MIGDQKQKLSLLPSKPGIYQFFNRDNKLLYVGKAKNLEKRVKSYFARPSNSSWTNLMVGEIADIKIIEVASESEAIMLENSLIKSLRPKYNILLRDDKAFPFVRVSRDNFPVFSVARKIRNDRAKYFGPYLAAAYVRQLLQLAQTLYGIRLASRDSYEHRSSLPAQIGLGPRNLDNKTAYAQAAHEAMRFISSPQPQMEKILQSKMKEASANQQFEKAAILRDRLRALQELRRNQRLFRPSWQSRDYVGIARAGGVVSAYILSERQGKIVNHYDYIFQTPINDDKQIVEWVIRYLYVNALPVPRELILPSPVTDERELTQILKLASGENSRLVWPKRGARKDGLQRALDNARYHLKLESLKKSRREEALARLAHMLELKKFPARIEAFDISNLGQTNIVGATIVFANGQPQRSEYRKYKIAAPDGQDDYAAMRELVYRRLSNKDRPFPDLVLIDGGKGQLSAAMEAANRAKVTTNIISIAKKEELIYMPNQSEPIVIPHDDPVLLLLTSIRDEVHRFAVSFHRHRRAQSMVG